MVDRIAVIKERHRNYKAKGGKARIDFENHRELDLLADQLHSGAISRIQKGNHERNETIKVSVRCEIRHWIRQFFNDIPYLMDGADEFLDCAPPYIIESSNNVDIVLDFKKRFDEAFKFVDDCLIQMFQNNQRLLINSEFGAKSDQRSIDDDIVEFNKKILFKMQEKMIPKKYQGGIMLLYCINIEKMVIPS